MIEDIAREIRNRIRNRIRIEKERHANAMEHRFGADRRKCGEWKQHQAQVEQSGRERRAEFRRRNNV